MSYRRNKLFALTMLTAILLVSALSTTFLIANAQSQATVVVLDSVGGTVTPTGTTTYNNGDQVTLTATAMDSTYIFSYWIISSDAGSDTVSDNPATITVAGGQTYAVQAVFDVVQPPPGVQTLPTNIATAALVVVLPAAGGTTNPSPGTYALADATQMMLTATANSGWQFSHWTISGSSTNHGGAPVNLTPTDNPYNVNHGYGYTYNYQAVFVPVGSNEPTPTPTASGGSIGGLTTETLIIIALVVVIVVILAAFGAYALRRNKHP
jgi:ABC-type glycerol-3-phosphate transport system permease component